MKLTNGDLEASITVGDVYRETMFIVDAVVESLRSALADGAVMSDAEILNFVETSVEHELLYTLFNLATDRKLAPETALMPGRTPAPGDV